MISRIGRVGTSIGWGLITWQIAIVSKLLLIPRKWVWRSVLMVLRWPSRGRVASKIASCTCVNTVWCPYPVSAPSYCISLSSSWISAAISFIMKRLLRVVIHLAWGRALCLRMSSHIVLLLLMWVLVAVTDDLVSLVVESWVLLGLLALSHVVGIEPIRSEENLISTLITVWRVASISVLLWVVLTLTFCADDHWRLVCWYPWHHFTTSLYWHCWLVGIAVVVTECRVSMTSSRSGWSSMLWGRLTVLAHNWASN